MAETTAIEWCDSTFNPFIGCTPVSPGCDNCYAARSTPARTMGVMWGAGQPRRRTSAANWKQPEQWQRQAAEFKAQHGRRRRVFCASLADVFDNEVPDEWRVDLSKLIAATPDLDWLLVTKRIGNVARMLGDHPTVPLLSNIWLGITVVNQAEVDRDVPKLLRVPAAVRFLSVEPMLGPVDLGLMTYGEAAERFGGGIVLTTRRRALDWVICGFESGPKARPGHPDWARSLRDQCAAADVAFNFKQHGEWAEVDGDKPTRTLRVESDIGETLASRCDGFISLAGEFVRSMDDATTDDPYRGLARIGKKAAGRLLDGRTHDGIPGGAS
jgi:protein gp37